MKKIFSIIAFALIVTFIASCQSSSIAALSTANSERDAFVDAQNTWKAGVHSFNDMKDAYGAPNNYADTSNGGFAVRWLRTTRVIVPSPATAPGGVVNEINSARFRPHHFTSVTRSLEAFYDANGILTNFRVNLVEQENPK